MSVTLEETNTIVHSKVIRTILLIVNTTNLI